MKFWIVFALLLISLRANAACFDEAAARYKVPVEILKAISKVESNGNPNARNTNANGSTDIGHMQINSSWLPTLAKYGIDEKKLADPCINTNIGAWVMAHNIARYGLTWQAVGAYNAVTPAKQDVYARKIESALKKKARS